MPSSSENNQTLAVPDTVNLTTKERIELVARLIADRIAEDEANDFMLLEEIKARYGSEQTT